MQLDLATGSRDNIPAAEKIVHLAAGSNPVGVGTGRGMHLWGFLMVLSLAICQTANLEPGSWSYTEGENLTERCKLCLPSLLKEQGTYQVPEVYEIRKKGKTCHINGTRFQICKTNGEILCYSQVASSKHGQSRAPQIKSRHRLNKSKRETTQKPIPTCNQCNQTVGIRRKMKPIFVAYFQVNNLCYDTSALSMCIINGKNLLGGAKFKISR